MGDSVASPEGYFTICHDEEDFDRYNAEQMDGEVC